MTLHHTDTSPVVGTTTLTAKRRLNRIRRDGIQIAIILAAAIVVVLFALAVKNGLAEKGIRFSFSFLWNAAGFDISEGKTFVLEDIWPSFVEFTADRSVAQAFVTGLVNTVKIAAIAIILSTVLGTLLGVGRLSTNWVVRNLSFWLVEFVRNTPLLIQLVFWYFAVVLHFPPMAAAAKFYGGVIVSQQGLYIPALLWNGDGSTTTIVLATLMWVAVLGAVFDRTKKIRWWCVGAAVVLVAAMFAIGYLSLDFPVATKFKAKGGTSMSPEMAALLLAIVVNSAAYIAEIVRGSIDALPKNQWEAAASLGLSRRNTVNDIILPQVFRVVLPSFGNQYISLTKNTALGIAIGYPELFNIYGTIANQTGHSLEGIIIVMVSYLILSWIISGLVSWADNRLSKNGAMR